MSKFSDYLEVQLVNHIFRTPAYSAPSTIYIGLFTADPTDAGSGAEVNPAGTWTDYERIDAANPTGSGAAKETGWDAPGATDGTTQNAKVITFPANNGAASVTVTHIGIYDAATSGNLLFHAPLASSKTLLQGDVLSFGIGAITVTLD